MLSVTHLARDLSSEGVPGEVCIFDIETGGLSAQYYPVLMLGLAYPHEGHWAIELHLCEHPSEEPLLLQVWNQAIHRYHVFLSYNGRSFDLPYLQRRSEKHALPIALPKERHIDLYIKGRLKEQEKKAGFERTDTLSGADWVKLHRTFVSEKLPSQKEALLRHNEEDLLGTIHLFMSRPEVREALPHRILGELFLYDATPAPGNLRLHGIDREGKKFLLDLPLLSFGRYHFLHIGPGFDALTHEEKQRLLLLDGRQLQYPAISEILSSDFVDKRWRQC